jgi:hypothetical protein
MLKLKWNAPENKKTDSGTAHAIPQTIVFPVKWLATHLPMNPFVQCSEKVVNDRF